MKSRTNLFFLALNLFATLITQSQTNEQILFTDTFKSYQNGSDGSPVWHPVKGNWQVIDSAYIQQASEYDCVSLLDFYLNESFQLEATFEHLDGEVGTGFIFSSHQNDNIGYAQLARFDGSTTFLTGYFQNGEFSGSASTQTDTIKPGVPHRLTLTVNRDDDIYSVLLDDKSIQENIPLVYPAGYVGLQSSGGRVRFHNIRLVTLPMRTKPSELNWVRHFAITSDHQFVIPNERTGSLQVFNDQGKLTKNIGTPAALKGQLHQPNAIAFLDDSTIVVTDRGSDQVHLFHTDGRWINSSGWKGTDRGQFDEPVAIAVNSNRQIFILEKNNHRVQVFDDSLHIVEEFGNDKLVAPLDFTIDSNHIYIINAGLSQIECYQWDGKKAAWKYFLSYGGGEGRGIASSHGIIYLSLVNEIRAYDTTGVLLHTLRGRSINFIKPHGIRSDYRNQIYIADFPRGRIIATTPELLDPSPVVTFENSRDAIITWESIEKNIGSVIVTTDNDTVSKIKERKPSAHHRITLTGLKTSTVYHYAIHPTISTIPPSDEFSRLYSFITPSTQKTKQYARLPMAALIFTNVVDEKKISSSLPAQPLLSDSEITRIKNQITDGVRFYWIHSGMNLFLDMDFILITDQLKRNALYSNEWWYPPRDSIFEKYLRLNGKDIKQYSGFLYLTCTQQYDTTLKKYVLAGKGGAFTNGVGTGKGYGISWWDVTKKNHNAGNNWLMVHEFNHQLDDIFLASGYPEYWFNHISPTIGTAAKFGEHFDANAYILRIVPKEEWLDLRYTEMKTTRDADEDGIPDKDPSLPLDEMRLKSDSTKIDTDGDGVSDLQELSFSNWITEGWGETYGGKAVLPNLRDKDTDHDGINDDIDPYPCYPSAPEIHAGSPTVDGTISGNEWHKLGELNDSRINTKIFDAWDSTSLYFAFDMDRAVPTKLMLDANGDGWFLGRDNFLITLTPKGDSLIDSRVQVFNATDPAQWPFMDQSLADKIHLTAMMHRHGNQYHVEISIPKNEHLGLGLTEGESLGLLIGFLCPFDEDGNKRYVDLFEPNRFFNIHLLRTK